MQVLSSSILNVLNASEKEGHLAFWALKNHRSAGVRVCTGWYIRVQLVKIKRI